MKVLIACEYSGIVRNAFAAAGHDAWSVDIIPSTSDGQHIIEDAITVAYREHWDLIIGHPPCTYLAKVQQWMCHKDPERAFKQVLAAKFFIDLYNAPAKHIALENPPGYMSKIFRPFDQCVHPWWYGDPYEKHVCLWLKNLPPLMSTAQSPGRYSMNRHTNGRMNQQQRSKIRSRFFPGIAAAMVQQWSDVVTLEKESSG